MQSGRLARNLIFREEMAYRGAYDFYRFVIPLAMALAVFGHLQSMVVLWYSLEKNQGQSMKEITTLPIFGVGAIASYILAFKFYKQCNAIETTPIVSQHKTSATTLSEEGIEMSDHLLGKAKPDKFYCNTCKIACEYRTRHCWKCGVCIERYDHHCFWIGNCVGRHNHRQFYLFLLTQTINNVCLYFLIDGLDLKGWLYWARILGLLLALGFCCFTGYLFIYHTMLISCGMTTWEHMRKTKISYLKYLPPGYNPFSLGICHNWRKFLNEATWATGSEEVQEWDSFIVPFDEAKTIQAGFNFIENKYYSCC